MLVRTSPERSGVRGDFPLWPPLLASRGPGGRSRSHAHHALHFILSIAGELEVRTEAGWQSAAGVLTGPDAVHEVQASGREVLIVFLDPESRAGEALRGVHGGRLRLITREERDALVTLPPRTLMAGDGVAWAQGAAASLGATAPAVAPVHPRVRRVLRQLREGEPSRDLSLAALAEIAGLSEGRFMHAFTESVGIPLRPYLAWLRLQRAAAAIVSGHTLAEAAHGAGFSDAAHMTRAFKRMLGIRPSELRASAAQP